MITTRININVGLVSPPRDNLYFGIEIPHVDVGFILHHEIFRSFQLLAKNRTKNLCVAERESFFVHSMHISNQKGEKTTFVGEGTLDMPLEQIMDSIIVADTHDYGRQFKKLHGIKANSMEAEVIEAAIVPTVERPHRFLGTKSIRKRKTKEYVEETMFLEYNDIGKDAQGRDIGVKMIYPMKMSISSSDKRTRKSQPHCVWVFVPTDNCNSTSVYYINFDPKAYSSPWIISKDSAAINEVLSDLIIWQRYLLNQRLCQFYFAHDDNWKPTFMVKQCHICNTSFRLKRRVHCNICGDIFCTSCCIRMINITIPICGKKQTRICRICHNSLTNFAPKPKIQRSSMSSASYFSEASSREILLRGSLIRNNSLDKMGNIQSFEKLQEAIAFNINIHTPYFSSK